MSETEVPKQIVLVRHAESERDALKGDQTFYPPGPAAHTLSVVASERMPLSEDGKQQAGRTGTAIREQFGMFDVVYHSGMKRSEETANGILAAYTLAERGAMPVRHSLRIHERDPGYTYGMTAEEANQTFPWLQKHFAVVDNFFGRPPGGESVADVALRVAPFFRKLNREHAGQNVLVITHGGVITSFRYYVQGWNYTETKENINDGAAQCCGVTVIKHDKAKAGLTIIADNHVYY